ncbi:MAG: hypothetical protein WD934_06625 [Gemmatimonadales bacterium]
MKSFEKLDAWKVCHALVLATWKATKPILDTERELAHRLRYVTLRAAGRLAFASAVGGSPMFMTAVIRADGYIAEAGYVLDLLRVMGTVPDPTWQELDGLRGRASFYVTKLLHDSYALPDDLRSPLDDLDMFDWDEPEDWQK